MEWLSRIFWRFVAVFNWTLFILALLWAVLAIPNLVRYYTASVALPNGMILRRQFDFTRLGRDDLLAADGYTVLASDIEYVCFNDRYAHVYTRSKGHGGGLYDGRIGAAIPKSDADAYEVARQESGLFQGRGSCNGYFTGMTGPSFFYDGNKSPFLPPCGWRNIHNKSLADRSWFERPCQ